MIKVHCPKCNHNMLYQPKPGVLKGKKKACVYCGYAIPVSDHIVTISRR